MIFPSDSGLAECSDIPCTSYDRVSDQSVTGFGKMRCMAGRSAANPRHAGELVRIHRPQQPINTVGRRSESYHRKHHPVLGKSRGRPAVSHEELGIDTNPEPRRERLVVLRDPFPSDHRELGRPNLAAAVGVTDDVSGE